MRPDTKTLVRAATLFYAVVAVVAWLWAFFFGDLSTLFGESVPRTTGLLKGVGAGLAIVAVCHLAYVLFRFVREASRVLGAFVGPLRPAEAVYLAVISGFAEELLFRGALWPHLGLVGTSILFGVLHTVPVRALAAYPIFAALAGLVFGLLREQTGSVLPPILGHITVNAINLAVIGGSQKKPPEPLPAPPTEEPEEELVLPKEMEEVGEEFPITIWRYDLRVELRGTDRQSMPDCLEHETLALFHYLPREQAYEAFREGLFEFVRSFAEPFPAFAHDVSTISTYLFQTVTGVEVAERYADPQRTDDVRAWKIVAQRGEWVKVPLLVVSPEEGVFTVDPEKEDVEVLAAHFHEYPRWFQDGMRFKYPSLR